MPRHLLASLGIALLLALGLGIFLVARGGDHPLDRRTSATQSTTVIKTNTHTQTTAAPTQTTAAPTQKTIGRTQTTAAPTQKTVGQTQTNLCPPVMTVATLRSSTQGFAQPNGDPSAMVPGTWFGAVSSLPVLSSQPGWLQIAIAQRPNGRIAWIRSSAATLSTTADCVVIDLRLRHLELFVSGDLALDVPAGIGTSVDPTPTGRFFVALFASAPSPGYGPFVIVTSAHSNAITDWDQSGDAVVAIHGPLGADAAIGTDGAAISHGCIRLHDVDLARLRDVPVGSLVIVTDA